MPKGEVALATRSRVGMMDVWSLLSGRAWKNVRCASSLFRCGGKYLLRRSVMRAWCAASVCSVRM